METVFFFKNMNVEQEEKLREYFLSKLPQLKKLISHFPDDAVLLQVKGEKFQKHSAFEVELVMKLPSETVSSKEASHTINKAVDLAKDRLTVQLKKNFSQLRRTHRSLRAKSKPKLRIAAMA